MDSNFFLKILVVFLCWGLYCNLGLGQVKTWSFEELFTSHSTGVVYLNTSTTLYQDIEKVVKIDKSKPHSHLVVRDLRIEIKESYRSEDFLPIIEFLKTKMSRWVFTSITNEGGPILRLVVENNKKYMYVELFVERKL